MDLDTNICITDDGSHTLYSHTFQSTYHSTFGAVQESRHVFIKSGLEYYVNPYSPAYVRILEVGFGTGLNAWLAWEYARLRQICVSYISIEPFPISIEQAATLNYPALTHTAEHLQKKFLSLHTCAWEKPVPLDNTFTLHKIKTTLNQYAGDMIDVVFFDAFDPSIVPHMWTIDVWHNLKKTMSNNAVLTTYCCKGDVKRGLKQAGFTIEKLKGPPGKREILRAMLAPPLM